MLVLLIIASEARDYHRLVINDETMHVKETLMHDLVLRAQRI
jgi:hypothetical protein